MERFPNSISSCFALFRLVLIISVIVTANGSTANLASRIVGGTQSEEGAFPYQVSLRYNSQPYCGGTLISRRHVLTAAHCAQSFTRTRITVISGTNSLAKGGETHGVATITIHPSYVGSMDAYRYDVAVLTLTAELTVTSLQAPIALATNDPTAGVTAVASGWGQTIYSSTSLPTKLQQTNLTILDNDVCRMILGQSVADVHMCAMDSYGTGVCSGDSGGPLAYNDTIVGIVSWGYPCALGVPDVYTRVTSVLSFVEEIINGS